MGKMNEQAKTVNHVLLEAMEAFGEENCFQIKQGKKHQGVSYKSFRTLTFRLVSFFAAQELNVGDRVAISAENSLEWIATYVACLLSGAVAVPLHLSTSPDALHAILQDSGARVAVLQDPNHVQHLLKSWSPSDAEGLSDLQRILTINETRVPSPHVTSTEELLAEPALTISDEAVIQTSAVAITPSALASIWYVASDTGELIGAVFEQAQCLAALRSMAAWFTFDDDEKGFTTRPLSEYPNLLVSLHYFVAGITNVLTGQEDNSIETMQQTSPTVMLSVPYSSELYYEEYMSRLAKQPEATQEVFRWALAKGREFRAAGKTASPKLRQEYAEADMTFFSQIRGEMGGHMRRSYSTSASLSEEVAEFFEAIGLSMINVYSSVAAGGFAAVSQPNDYQPGSCGQAAPGFQIRLADDGEVLIRGETVMREFWQRPEATKVAFDDDGWLCSGDIGHFDENNYLYITDRKRHLIVMSRGRKIVPTVIENMLTASPFITQAALVGEGKPYLSAMIVPDLGALATHFKEVTDDEGKPVSTTTHPKVKELLDQVISEVNSRLDRWEQVREYSLLDQPLSQETGELTASMKISRHVVAQRHAEQIEAMYPETHQLETGEVSKVQVEPERLRELLEKESILDAWMADAGIEFLFKLARAMQIDAPSMVHICDTAAMIAQMESEEKPLSTAIIVGDPVRIGRVLPSSQIQLLESDHIRRMRKNLVTLAKMVDGLVLGYVIDKHGYVRGIHKLNVTLDEPVSFFLGPQFRHHAAISRLCEAMVFFVPAGGRQVRVFAEGELVGRYSNGDWAPESMLRADEIVVHLAQDKNYDLGLVRRVLRCAFQMSEKNLGAIFIIGDADAVLEHSDASEISHFALMLSAPMDQLSDEELINFAQQDGATVIDTQGKFRGCMVLLRPDAETQAEIGPGKGARHSSAAKMSAEAQCMAITVSHDGPITVYDNGQRVLSL
jgi:long-chain acyl-CoA synthetase